MDKNILITLDEFEQAGKYWQEKLSGPLQPMSLRGDFPRGHRYEAGQHRLTIGPAVGEELRRLSKNHDLSLYILLLAVFKILLFKQTGQADITVTAPIFNIANREYNRYLAFRDMLSRHMTFKDVLMAVKQTVIEGYKNEFYPLAPILEPSLKSGESGPGWPWLTLDAIHAGEIIKEGEPPWPNELTLAFQKNGREIAADIVYNARLFLPATIARFCAIYTHILGQVAGEPNRPLAGIELVSPAEKQKILYEFNHPGPVDQPPAMTIQQLFTGQAERTPDRKAVSAYIDIGQIYEELRTEEVTPRAWDKIAKCCFSRPSTICERPLQVAGVQGDYKILKTHTHKSVAVNGNVRSLLSCFTGERPVEAIFSTISSTDATFFLHSFGVEDVLEIVSRFSTKEEITLDGKRENFVRLIKSLYRLDLLEWTGYQTRPIGADRFMPDFTPGPVPPAVGRALDSLLKPSEPLPRASVLLLGDTVGMPTTGLLYLAAYLRRNGISAVCRFFDTDTQKGQLQQDIFYLLQQIKPRFVAVSLKWFLHIARVREICRIIKSYSADIQVIVGGNTASYYDREVFLLGDIDYLVRGDGELPLLKICREEDEIPNCLYRRHGQRVDNPITYVQDEHNSADIFLSHLDEILLSPDAPFLGTFFIFTHKGCRMNCLYCGGCRQAQEKTFQRPAMFLRRPGEVRKDILEAKRFASRFLFDFDSGNEKLLVYCREIWEGIDLTGHFCALTNLIPPCPALLAYVQKTFKYIFWNLDIASLSEKHRLKLASLGLVKPQPTDQEIFSFFDECEKYTNLEIQVNMIAGLPYFDAEDLEQSETMIRTLMNRYRCFGGLNWARLHAQPGAPISQSAEQYDMRSLAASFDDFRENSEANFSPNQDYPGLEYYQYPFIYYRDDAFNSRISRHYAEINRQVEHFRQQKRERLLISESLTYRELADRAGRLAAALSEKGVGPDTLVALLIQDPLEVPVAILGVLLAGGAYLPLDPDYPPERIDYMLQDSGSEITLNSALSPVRGGAYAPSLCKINAEATIGTRAGAGFIRFPFTTGQNCAQFCLRLHELRAFRNSVQHARSGDCCCAPRATTSLAYVIYTSGTAGRPKGVAVEQQGLVNYTRWRIEHYGLTERDVTLQPLAYTFDGFNSNFYSTLCSGGELVMVPDSCRRDVDFLVRVMADSKATNTSLVPGLYGALLAVAAPHDLGTLRFVVLAGEKAGDHLLDTSRAVLPGTRLINEYGPTETTVTATANLDLEPGKTGIIGQPIAHTGGYILNTFLDLLPIGEVGELFISGPGVARGYLNNPELTAEKFVCADIPIGAELTHQSPSLPAKTVLSFACGFTNCGFSAIRFSMPVPGIAAALRLFKTGDLCRWLADGRIELLGREDQQVKIRGFRVEVGEIESRLSAHDQIREAVVLSRENQQGEKYLCAYLTAHNPQTGPVDTPALRAFLGRTLPDYMIPAHFLWLERIPLTSHGKVDYRALPDPTALARDTRLGPRDEVEEQLVHIWSEVLGLDSGRIGIDDNFFELGGHSLSATILVARVHKEMNVRIPLNEVFKTPSIQAMSGYIRLAEPRVFTAIRPVEEREYYPVSSAQMRMFLVSQIKGADTSDNVPNMFRVEGPFDPARLKQAIMGLIKRHEALRTSFELVDDTPVQRVHERVAFELEVFSADGRGGRCGRSEQELIETIVQGFVRPFDLGRAPLLRVGLVEFSPGKYLLAYDIHHIIVDDLSYTMFIDEFIDLYEGKELPALKLQYRDFACWQGQRLYSESIEKQEKYWLQVFSGKLPRLDLHTDFPRPAVQSFVGDTVTHTFNRDLTRRLGQLAKGRGVTFYMVMLAVYTILLSKYSGQTDIIVGTPTAGRPQADLDNVIGMFVNTLAMRNFPGNDKTFDQFLEEVKKNTLGAFENQDFQFEALVDRLAIKPDPGRHPLFDTMLAGVARTQAGPDAGAVARQIKDVSFKPLRVDQKITQFDIIIHAYDHHENIGFRLRYCTEIFKRDTMEKLLAHFEDIATSVTENPGLRLGDIYLSHGFSGAASSILDEVKQDGDF